MEIHHWLLRRVVNIHSSLHISGTWLLAAIVSHAAHVYPYRVTDSSYLSRTIPVLTLKVPYLGKLGRLIILCLPPYNSQIIFLLLVSNLIDHFTVAPQSTPMLEGALKGIHDISPDSGWLRGHFADGWSRVFCIRWRHGIFGPKVFGLEIIWPGAQRLTPLTDYGVSAA